MRAGDLEQYLEESRGLERDYLEELVRSRRAAWRVAAGAAVLVAAALAALVALVPLKRVEAFVLRVDNATGAVDLVTTLRDGQASYGEVVDRYFLNKYVLARESYDYETLQSAYDTTALMSSGDVQREYAALFDGPMARDKVLANRVRIMVNVRSIAPRTTRNTAIVRFVTRAAHADGTSEAEESLVATIAFRYVGGAMHEQDRLVNPLGFQVTSYRVDPEIVGGR
ncbi:virB8 family protein [Anaeromyxobacter sp. PSR-1]|uniref:virB8 family protein n=1 Tax=Anaeromyxobacter sp. PSR-1 TaxID=1300915 RepID=UPI0005EA1EEE|nr:type IV secretion system protein [Anaeromyxobacter sp. PSR-1]GAO01284.1 type IV secretion system protein virB8 [Anaeromyxobacter sp. PSR-1]